MTKWSKTSAYSRFIPSEEIDDVAEWRFDNVDGTPHVVQIEPQLPPGPTPEEIEAQVEAAREQAFQAGYTQGHADGCQATRDELAEPTRLAIEANRARVEQIVDHMHTQFDQMQDQMAQTILHMACNIARQVIRRELTVDPQSIQPVIADALNLLKADTLPVTIRLNPDDFDAINVAESAITSSAKAAFEQDYSITPGGCVLENALSSVDATLETRWSRAIA
ncbi:MAG: FliH/SctL family protein, partial [Burkholderiaceae bacterium]